MYPACIRVPLETCTHASGSEGFAMDPGPRHAILHALRLTGPRTAAELAALGRDLRHEMFNLRLQQASSQLEKPSRMRELRKSIARVETQLSVLRNTRKAA